jgi:hypothetical protein
LPADLSGRTAEVFVFLVSLEENGLSANRESISSSVYAGSVAILQEMHSPSRGLITLSPKRLLVMVVFFFAG